MVAFARNCVGATIYVMTSRMRVLLSQLEGDLPTEFRIFKAGVNHSSKGDVLFDEAAAAQVMSVYQREGVDLMVDLEHQSLDAPIREDSADARGWFQLAVRNGELWAVNVKWTADGARRLTEKTQRYISPAFFIDKEDRAIEIINVALCAMPATLDAPALVAASRLRAANARVSFTSKQRASAYRLLEKLKNGSRKNPSGS